MDDQTLAKVEHDVARLNLADHIIAWDKKQIREVWDPDLRRLVPNPTARLCQTDLAHGVLQMHANGAVLMCCATRPTPCDYAEPVSR